MKVNANLAVVQDTEYDLWIQNMYRKRIQFG